MIYKKGEAGGSRVVCKKCTHFTFPHLPSNKDNVLMIFHDDHDDGNDSDGHNDDNDDDNDHDGNDGNDDNDDHIDNSHLHFSILC